MFFASGMYTYEYILLSITEAQWIHLAKFLILSPDLYQRNCREKVNHSLVGREV
jgi:hypothetical protein